MEYFISYIVEFGSPEDFQIVNCFIEFNGKLKIENNLAKIEKLALESTKQVTPIDLDDVTNVSVMNCYKLLNKPKQVKKQTIENFDLNNQKQYHYNIDYIITDGKGFKTYEEGLISYPHELDNQKAILKMLESMYRQFPDDYIISVMKIEKELIEN